MANMYRELQLDCRPFKQDLAGQQGTEMEQAPEARSVLPQPVTTTLQLHSGFFSGREAP